MIPAAFVAGWIVGAFSLALVIGATLRWLDIQAAETQPVQVDEVPLYVPQEWIA